MNSKLPLAPRTFPSRIADLGFNVQLPRDWVAHELPAEEPDFSNSTTLFPLAVVTAPHAALVFAFAARPAFDDGTLHDWAWHLVTNNGIKPRAIGPGQVGQHQAIIGEGTQDSEMGPLVIRFAFLEDGKRLVNISLTVPEMFEELVRDAWLAALNSFTLESPKGLTTEMQKPAPASTPAAEAPSAPKAAGFAAHALQNDATALDPESSMNANLRARGAGLVPRVRATNDAEKRATVAAGAVVAFFDVPYGWHVIDDGKRTLVFEPSGKVQINLGLIPREGRDNREILDAIEAATRQDYPAPEFLRLSEGPIDALGVRNIADGDQALEQYHLLYPFRDDSMVVRARITTTPDQSGSACNLGELVLKSFNFGPA